MLASRSTTRAAPILRRRKPPIVVDFLPSYLKEANATRSSVSGYMPTPLSDVASPARTTGAYR